MHGMKSQMELADEEFEANLAKAVAMDANEKGGRNPSAMREALESCLVFIMRLDRAFNPFMQNLLENAIAKASAALAVPPNDLLMKAEEEVQAARKAYKEICEGD